MTALAERPQTNGAMTAAPLSPMAVIQLAIEKGVDPDQLGKLMDLQERFEKNRAAEEYGRAVAEFQKRCPAIHKGREANIVSQKGSYKYKFAGYDDVMKVAQPHLAACGIAVSFSTEANDRGIRVTIRVRVGTHAEDCTLDVPVPAMNVNDTQKYGAALSYAKRYAFCAALNVVVTDEDTDAANICLDPISEEQEIQLTEMLERFQNPQDEKTRFLKWLGVDRIVDIPARDFTKAINGLKGKLNARH